MIAGTILMIFVIATFAAIVAIWIFVDFGTAALVAIVCGVVYFVAFQVYFHIVGIRRQFFKHFGRVDVGKLAITSRRIPKNHRADVQIALNELYSVDGESIPIVGLINANIGGSVLLYAVGNNMSPAALQWTTLPKSQKETIQVVENGLYFLRLDGDPVALAVSVQGQGKRKLEIVAKTSAVAQAMMEKIFQLAYDKSIYRGEIVCLEMSKRTPGRFAIRFHPLPSIRRDEIVLPGELMNVIERNILSHLHHRDILRQAGQSTRRGVLLTGPPGVGKTLVAKHLARRSQDTTVIILTGRQLALIRESCLLARLLSPSMVIFEDVDLVAEHRDTNRENTLLHELMDEMDGMGENIDCIFLMTTNNPDVLEPALASRPGRVDQAIFFPLPDRESRQRLFKLFGAKLNMTDVDLEILVEKTEGTSPAFIKELFRKAVLFAVERGESENPLRIKSSDFDAAFRELVGAGGKLANRLLGFQSGLDDVRS